MVKAHLAASYAIGDEADAMVEIPDKLCVCGLRIVPLFGKVSQGTTIKWDIWIEGLYEHIQEIKYPHIPKPIRDWN